MGRGALRFSFFEGVIACMFGQNDKFASAVAIGPLEFLPRGRKDTYFRLRLKIRAMGAARSVWIAFYWGCENVYLWPDWGIFSGVGGVAVQLPFSEAVKECMCCQKGGIEVGVWIGEL